MGPASPTDNLLESKVPSQSLFLYLEGIFRDLGLSCRALARSTGFTAVVVVTLALGIGVNTTVFTLFDAVFLRPLPVADSHQIATLHPGSSEYSYGGDFSFPEYLHIERKNHAFSGMIAWSPFVVHLKADGFTERLDGEMVSSNYLDVLGIEPILGRGFLPEEGEFPGRRPVALISSRLWHGRFRSRADIVGKNAKVNGHIFTLIGVFPEYFNGLSLRQADIWVPLTMQPQVQSQRWTFGPKKNWFEDPDHYWLDLAGRLGPDTSRDSARSSLAALVPELRLLDRRWEDNNLVLAPGHHARLYPRVRTRLQNVWILLTAIAGSVLLIACANVANLLLSRARTKRRDMAIRLATGANREHLIRYLLIETTVLFLAAGGLAFLMAFWCLDLLGTLPLLPRVLRAAAQGLGLLDGRMLFFTLVLSLTTAIIFGLVPATRASRIQLFPELKSIVPYAHGQVGRWRHALVVIQVALSATLLVVAALFIRSLGNQLAVEPGFDPENVYSLSVDVATQGYSEAKGSAFFRATPQTCRDDTRSGISDSGTFRSSRQCYARMSFRSSSGETGTAEANAVFPRYLETVGLPLIQGRDFRWTDDQDSRPVAIISQTIAERFWPNADATGQQFPPYGSDGWEVIGVARELQFRRLGDDPAPQVYFPLLQQYGGSLTLMARIQPQETSTVMASMRQAVRELDADLPTYGAPSLSATVAERVYQWRLLNLVLSSFGILALTLASVGLFGVLSHSVARRTREIAVRLAMGARRDHAVWLILRRALVLVVIGLVVGIAFALAATRIIRNFVELEPADPVAILVSSFVIVVASLVACWVPAYRITRLEPMEALRHE